MSPAKHLGPIDSLQSLPAIQLEKRPDVLVSEVQNGLKSITYVIDLGMTCLLRRVGAKR